MNDKAPPGRRTPKVVFIFLLIHVTGLIWGQGVLSQSQMKVPDNGDYSRFQHTTAYHARLPCSLCHRRDSSSIEPAIPGGNKHLPCAGCHVKQFADSANQICTICHTDSRSGGLKAFPRLATFNLKFNHSRHVSLTNVSCNTCHRSTRGGLALTIPFGFNAHRTCFQCHGPQSKSGDRDISSCGVCHQQGTYRRATQNAPAFRVGFNHERHNRDEGLSCTACHRVQASARDITAPQPLNHHASAGSFSCMSCHNGKRAFSGDDFSSCKRCHTGTTWHF